MFSLKVLGGAVLEGPDGPMTGRPVQKRRLALLAVLALARRPVGRERLIGLLWPEHPGDKARHLLSESLYVIRSKALGEDALLSTGDEVTLNPHVVSCDAVEFEAALEAGELERAASLYRGAFLDGLYLSDAPDFDPWVDGERDRLARACARAVEQLAERAEAEARPVDAVEWWRRLAAHDPYSTRVALRLLKALEAAGDPAAALRFAKAHTDFLIADLGSEPKGEFPDYVAHLRDKYAPSPAPPAAPGPKPPATQPVLPPQLQLSPAPDRPADVVRPADVDRPAEVDPPAEVDLPADVDLPPDTDPPADADLSADADRPVGTGLPAGSDGSAPADRGARCPSPAGSGDVLVEPEPDELAWLTGFADSVTGHHGARRRDDAPPPVSPSDADPSTHDAALPPGAALPARERRRAPPPKPRARRPAWTEALAYYAGMAGMLAGLVLAVLTVPEPPERDPRRIAVLYFDDNTPGGELGHLASGLTGLLIDRLGEVEALSVVSSNGVKPYSGGTIPLDSVVADLEVGSVVEGRIQRSGDRLRVTVSLIDANTVAQLESRTIEAPMGELFALEDRVVEEVAGFLRRRLGEEIRFRERRNATRNVAARELVLRAEQERARAEALSTPGGPQDAAGALRLFRRADSLLARAAEADPRWAEPWVLRGWARVGAARLEPDPRVGYGEAVGYAGQALERSGELPAALELRGAARLRIARRDSLPPAELAPLLDAAERDLRAATEADGSRAVAWSTLSQLLRQRGALVEADEAAGRALAEDAWLEDAEMILDRLYRAKYNLARFDSAAAWCERGARQFPSSWRFLDCRLTLLGADGGPPPDVGAAWRLVETADRVDPPVRARAAGREYFPVYRRMVVARVLARAGQVDSARAVVARARLEAGSDPELTVPLLYDRAVVHVLLGEHAAALDALEAYARAKPRIRDFLATDVQLRVLHGHPRFRALVTPARSAAAADPARAEG